MCSANLSLTRFAFRNPNGITCGHAAFDLLLQNSSITKKVIDSFCFSLQNSSITKRCFVILSRAKNLCTESIADFFVNQLTVALTRDGRAVCLLWYMPCRVVPQITDESSGARRSSSRVTTFRVQPHRPSGQSHRGRQR